MEQLPWSFRGKGLTLFLWPEPWSSIRRKRRGVLKAAAGLLKPEGTLYFAAENAAGVRYWMGAERFDVSFLRAEVLELLESLEGTYGGSSFFIIPFPITGIRRQSTQTHICRRTER